MKFNERLLRGILIKRYKRFLADVLLDSNELVTVHCPNSGSMLSCSEPGRPVYVSRSNKAGRRYPYTWELIDMHGALVGVNTGIPNRLVVEAWEEGRLPGFGRYASLKREVRYGTNSRIDVLLQGDAERCFIEIKNVTLVRGQAIQFPDAVTTRGAKHLIELIGVKRQGQRAVMMYVIQRPDGLVFSIADDIDREYGRLVRDAIKAGVELYAYRAVVTVESIVLGAAVPIMLDPGL